MTPTCAELLWVASVMLVAVTVYTPALPGAVSVTLPPFRLTAELNEPPLGLMLQRTPALSLVVAEKGVVGVMVSPAACGEMATDIFAGLTFKVRLTNLLCVGLPLSETVNVSGVPFAVADGVPAMAPVDEFREIPAGSVPEVSDHESGGVPPLAANIEEYGLPI